MDNNPLLLIDADITLYTIASGQETVVEWDDGVCSIHGDTQEAFREFDLVLSRLLDCFQTNNFVLALSDKANFRKSVFPSYKSNRVGRKPVGYAALRSKVVSHYADTVQTLDSCEGDDVISINATKPSDSGSEVIIVSTDKDFKQIPNVPIYNPVRKTMHISDKEVAENFLLMQCLAGDPVDGYRGLKGYGPVSANKILDSLAGSSFEDKYDYIENLFVSKGSTKEDCLSQLRCARLLRWGEYNFTTKEPILWKK